MPDFNLKKIFNRDFLALAYKLLNDTLFLMLIAYGIVIFAEGVVPGFISGFLSLTAMTIAILVNLGLVAYLRNKLDYQTPAPSSSKKNFGLTAFFTLFIFLTILSILKFSIWEIIITAILSLAILYYFYKSASSLE